jgi:hypothetical protein
MDEINDDIETKIETERGGGEVGGVASTEDGGEEAAGEEEEEEEEGKEQDDDEDEDKKIAVTPVAGAAMEAIAIGANVDGRQRQR